MTTCLCGHFCWMTAWVIGPSLILSVVLFLFSPRKGWNIQSQAAGLLPILLLAAKCAADLLWNGHEAILRR